MQDDPFRVKPTSTCTAHPSSLIFSSQFHHHSAVHPFVFHGVVRLIVCVRPSRPLVPQQAIQRTYNTSLKPSQASFVHWYASIHIKVSQQQVRDSAQSSSYQVQFIYVECSSSLCNFQLANPGDSFNLSNCGVALLYLLLFNEAVMHISAVPAE